MSSPCSDAWTSRLRQRGVSTRFSRCASNTRLAGRRVHALFDISAIYGAEGRVVPELTDFENID